MSGVERFEIPKAPPPPTHSDGVREKVALRLIWVLAGALLVAVGVGSCLAVRLDSLEPVTVLATAVVTPVVGLVGSVVGFYFGNKSGRGGG